LKRIFKQKTAKDESQTPSASWWARVYHLPQGLSKDELERWKKIAKVVKARDKHTCQSCRIKIGLGVHHIIPRDVGGKDDMSNLITLCENCHNGIELLDIKTKAEIKDFKSRDKRKYIKKNPHLVTNDKPLYWQQWVYGGYRKPEID